jgi:hypothetical protein
MAEKQVSRKLAGYHRRAEKSGLNPYIRRSGTELLMEKGFI